MNKHLLPLLLACLSPLYAAENSIAGDEILGSKGNHTLIIASNKTNGSSATTVNWVEKNKDKVTILKTLASGDRCKGGVKKIKDWQYAVNLTPVDLVSLGTGAALKLDAYRDLDASATSCVAEAIYEFNPDTQMAKLLHVKLASKEMTMESWVLDLNFQYCFNRLFNTYLDRGQIILTQTDLNRFKNEFEGICMASGR